MGGDVGGGGGGDGGVETLANFPPGCIAVCTKFEGRFFGTDLVTTKLDSIILSS